MSEKLRIELGDKYVVTGSAHDLILNEKKISKEGKNAGQGRRFLALVTTASLSIWYVN